VTAGNVAFRVDGTAVATVTLNAAGQAAFSTSALGVGGRAISATYDGTSTFGTSTGSLTQTVNKANTTTAVASSANPSTYGQSATFTATVSTVSGSVVTEGTVTFKEGSTVLAGPLALNATGQVSFFTTTLWGGSHPITADYSGSANFNPSTGAVAQTVNKANTQTALAVSPAALGGAWVTRAGMPTARNGAPTAAVDGIIYVTGGWNSFHRTAVEAYDPTTNSWSARPDRPYPGQTNGAVGVIGGTMYIAGGTDCCVEVNTLDAYTPATNTWTAKASMPTTRQLAAGGVIDGVFYVAGGLNSVGAGPHGIFGTLEAYDPTSNTWTAKATMPTARSAPAGAVLGNKFYVLGGSDGTTTCPRSRCMTRRPTPGRPRRHCRPRAGTWRRSRSATGSLSLAA